MSSSSRSAGSSASAPGSNLRASVRRGRRSLLSTPRCCGVPANAGSTTAPRRLRRCPPVRLTLGHSGAGFQGLCLDTDDQSGSRPRATGGVSPGHRRGAAGPPGGDAGTEAPWETAVGRRRLSDPSSPGRRQRFVLRAAGVSPSGRHSPGDGCDIGSLRSQITEMPAPLRTAPYSTSRSAPGVGSTLPRPSGGRGPAPTGTRLYGPNGSADATARGGSAVPGCLPTPLLTRVRREHRRGAGRCF